MRLERGTLQAEQRDDGVVTVCRAGHPAIAVELDPDDARWLMLVALPTILSPYRPGKEHQR